MNRVKEARFQKKKTQTQISGLTGLTQSKLSYIENFRWNPSEEEKIKLENALGFSRDWLFPKNIGEENS